MTLKYYEEQMFNAHSRWFSKADADKCKMAYRHFKETYGIVDKGDASSDLLDLIKKVCEAASKSGEGSISYDHAEEFKTYDKTLIITLQPYGYLSDTAKAMDRLNMILRYNPYRKRFYRAELSTDAFHHPSVPAVIVFIRMGETDGWEGDIELRNFESSYFSMYSTYPRDDRWSSDRGSIVGCIENYERFKCRYGIVGAWKVPRAISSFIEGGRKWWFDHWRCDGFITKDGDKIITLSPVGERDSFHEKQLDSLNEGMRSLSYPNKVQFLNKYCAEWYSPGFYCKDQDMVVIRPISEMVE